MKQCSKCRETKETALFSKNNKAKDGLFSYCKPCVKAVDKLRSTFTPSVEEQQCAACKEVKKAECFTNSTRSKSGLQSYCKDCMAGVGRDTYNKEQRRDRHLKRAYGLARTDYDNMYSEQDGRCAICNIKEIETPEGTLCVDHDHATGKVRSLLCKQCNHALGLFQDNPLFCNSAANYLRKHNK
jgi:hypothetical protein